MPNPFTKAIQAARTGILSRIQKIFKPEPIEIQGSTRGLGGGYSQKNHRDLEVYERPVRPNRGIPAIVLIEMVEHCAEVKAILRHLVRDTFSSTDGDDQGWTISDTLDDNLTPVDPKIKEIALNLITRRYGYRHAVGGRALREACRRTLAYGDGFVELGIGKDQTGQWAVMRSVLLPTWEMFRKEDEHGNLEYFEQRKSVDDREGIQFIPSKLVHFCHDRKGLYGQSLFSTCGEDWAHYKVGSGDYAQGARLVGIDPVHHKLPLGTSTDNKKEYEEWIRQEKETGLISDYVTTGDVQITPVGGKTDLSGLKEHMEARAKRLIMVGGVPVWMFPGMDTTGARDISGQPAKAYARLINDVRGMMSEGIRQIIDLELALKGIPPEQWQYSLVWPKIVTDPSTTSDDESNATGITDLD